MPKTTKKLKGNRFEKVRYHIPYYTTAFFNQGGELEDGEVTVKKASTVKIPIKIAADGDDSRANVTTFEMKGISHFDNNVENVLESLSQLEERVIKPKAIADAGKRFRTKLKMLQLICNSGPASQTLQEAMRKGREYVVEEVVDRNVENVSETDKDNLINDETAFYDYLDQEFEDVAEELGGTDGFSRYMYQEFERATWNHLHSIIFGADTYKAFKEQKDYLMHMISKPFGVTVEAAFRRIEVITKLMEYFPPTSSRGRQATQEQWDAFNKIKKISSAEKREMKYNLLPDSFHDRFEQLDDYYADMTNTKFVSAAQQCEATDAKERLKQQKEKEKKQNAKKRKAEDDSVSTLSRSQRSNNSKGKARRDNNATKPQGEARMCELCKLAGAPESVYKTHFTNQCRKKDYYAKALSGGAGSRQKAQREYRTSEKQLKRELKLIRTIKKLKASKKKHDSKDDENSSISSKESDDISY